LYYPSYDNNDFKDMTAAIFHKLSYLKKTVSVSIQHYQNWLCYKLFGNS